LPALWRHAVPVSRRSTPKPGAIGRLTPVHRGWRHAFRLSACQFNLTELAPSLVSVTKSWPSKLHNPAGLLVNQTVRASWDEAGDKTIQGRSSHGQEGRVEADQASCSWADQFLDVYPNRNHRAAHGRGARLYIKVVSNASVAVCVPSSTASASTASFTVHSRFHSCLDIAGSVSNSKTLSSTAKLEHFHSSQRHTNLLYMPHLSYEAYSDGRANLQFRPSCLRTDLALPRAPAAETRRAPARRAGATGVAGPRTLAAAGAAAAAASSPTPATTIMTRIALTAAGWADIPCPWRSNAPRGAPSVRGMAGSRGLLADAFSAALAGPGPLPAAGAGRAVTATGAELPRRWSARPATEPAA